MSPKFNSDRIKEIQATFTAYPNSRSVTEGLMQVWNEVQQECDASLAAMQKELEERTEERDFARRKFEEAASRNTQEKAELEGGLGVAQARIKVLENALRFYTKEPVCLCEIGQQADPDCPLHGIGSDDHLARLQDTITAQAARIARLEEALEVAKEAMDERRGYVNGGNPSACWQEMKYGEIWDQEDAQVSAALTPPTP